MIFILFSFTLKSKLVITVQTEYESCNDQNVSLVQTTLPDGFEKLMTFGFNTMSHTKHPIP